MGEKTKSQMTKKKPLADDDPRRIRRKRFWKTIADVLTKAGSIILPAMLQKKKPGQ